MNENIFGRSILKTSWRKLPVIIRAIISGILVSAAGTLPWAALVALNIKYLPSVPWSVIPATIYLWFYWKYFIRGKGWPRSTGSFRKKYGRGNFLSGESWGASILAGILGLGSLLAFSSLLGRMIQLPQQNSSGAEHVPTFTLFFMVLMGSAVAGITEETGFRGYLQKPIEERHGPFIAILITGIIFGTAHFTHSETTIALLPYYVFFSAVYGMLAYFTNSIFPGMTLHAAGNVFSGMNLFTRGQSEWSTSKTAQPLIWESGLDTSFILSLLAFVVIGSLTAWAYVALAKLAKRERSSDSEDVSPGHE